VSTRSTAVPDIPPIGNVKSAPTDSDPVRDRLRRQYSSLIQTHLYQIAQNTAAYVNKRSSPTSSVGPQFKRVYKDATFIPAHPTRYQVGGNDYEKTQAFVLHRPGFDAASSQMANLVREFTQPWRQASTHFGVSQFGQIVQFVDLADIAYHTGSNRVPNHTSVGVEMEGEVGAPISNAMYRAVASLIARVHVYSGMPIDEAHVVQHSAILPGSKADAGQNVSIPRLIHEAQALTGTYNRDDLFKPPFTPAQNTTEIAGTVMALAAASGNSGLDLALLQWIASSSVTQARAMSINATGRSDLSTAAVSAENSAAVTYASQYALALSFLDLKVSPTPQANVTGVLRDSATGLFNDGEP